MPILFIILFFLAKISEFGTLKLFVFSIVTIFTFNESRLLNYWIIINIFYIE